MKPSQSSKTSVAKTKKTSKDRDKKKSQGGTAELNNHSSPVKENTRMYAGIDADSLLIYAEQTGIDQLPPEATNILTEDINYKLRYIINDCLIKARLSGRNAISSSDVEQTFENLQIDKVYGAPAQPNWVPFGYQNLYYLNDGQINLVEAAQEHNVYHQHTETIITSKWLPDKDISKNLKTYFITMCQALVSGDPQVQKMALSNISDNSRIAPIIEWFYNFGYILLSKDITYDCLTLRALDLIQVLENSPSCAINVSEKLLKLLVRLILQRLLKSATTNEVLKPMCTALSVICQRRPLKEFVILKILQKIGEVSCNYTPVVTAANCLGADAIKRITLPYLVQFLVKMDETLVYSILESYYIMCKENLIDSLIYELFYELFGDTIIIFNRTGVSSQHSYKRELNFVTAKCNLLKTCRKVYKRTVSRPLPLDEVFDLPTHNCKLRKKLDEHKWNGYRRQTNVIIGKTSLMLPIFKKNKHRVECHDHTLWYSL